MVLVDIIFHLAERRTDSLSHLFQKYLAKSVSEESIIEMLNCPPGSEVAGPALGDKTMDMGIPFEIAPEGVEDTNEPGSKVFGLIDVVKHTKNNVSDGMKETVQERTVAEKVDTQLFGDSKNAVTVDTGNELGGHAERTYLIVLVATGRTETAVTADGYEFEIAAVRACIHGTAIGGITAVDHLINVFDHGRSWMKKIKEFFIMFFKNGLQYVHKAIMQQKKEKENP